MKENKNFKNYLTERLEVKITKENENGLTFDDSECVVRVNYPRQTSYGMTKVQVNAQFTKDYLPLGIQTKRGLEEAIRELESVEEFFRTEFLKRSGKKVYVVLSENFEIPSSKKHLLYNASDVYSYSDDHDPTQLYVADSYEDAKRYVENNYIERIRYNSGCVPFYSGECFIIEDRIYTIDEDGSECGWESVDGTFDIFINNEDFIEEESSSDDEDEEDY